MTADTTALVVALERERLTPGTLPLFDALTADDAPAVAARLAEFPRHPLRAEFVEWLAARGLSVPPPPTATEVCVERGIVDLIAHLDGLEKQVRVQGKGMETTLARAQRAESVANAYAAVLVVVAAIALLGWAAALDYLALFEPAPPVQRPAATAPIAPNEGP